MADETKIEVTDAMVEAAVIAIAREDAFVAEVLDPYEIRDLARAALVAGLAVAHA